MPRNPREFGLIPKRPEPKPVAPEPSLQTDIEGVDEDFLAVITSRFEGMALEDVVEFLKNPDNEKVKEDIETAIRARKRLREMGDPEEAVTIVSEEEDLDPSLPLSSPATSVHDLEEILAEDPTKEFVEFDPEKAEDVRVESKGEERGRAEMKQKYPGVPSKFQPTERALESLGSMLKQVKTASGWNTPFIPGRFFGSPENLAREAMGIVSKIAWKNIPFEYSRKPGRQPKPGDLANRYCPKCKKTTKHKLLEGGGEECVELHEELEKTKPEKKWKESPEELIELGKMLLGEGEPKNASSKVVVKVSGVEVATDKVQAKLLDFRDQIRSQGRDSADFLKRRMIDGPMMDIEKIIEEGDVEGIAAQYYPGWTTEDFQAYLEGLRNLSEEIDQALANPTSEFFTTASRNVVVRMGF